MMNKKIAFMPHKTRKQRGITSIKKDMEFNQRLWGVASEYLAAA